MDRVRLLEVGFGVIDGTTLNVLPTTSIGWEQTEPSDVIRE